VFEKIATAHVTILPPHCCLVAVTTGEVSLGAWTARWNIETKKIFLQIRSYTLTAVIATVAAMGVSSHGLQHNVLTSI
jgi:hypothetical protein